MQQLLTSSLRRLSAATKASRIPGEALGELNVTVGREREGGRERRGGKKGEGGERERREKGDKQIQYNQCMYMYCTLYTCTDTLTVIG